MVLFAPALFWLNGLYLRVIGALRPKRTTRIAAGASAGRSSSSSIASMAIALVALLAWIFFLGERPPYTVW